MDCERVQPDDLADFERLAVNCYTLCEDPSIDSITADGVSLAFVAKDSDSVQYLKHEVGSITECEADKLSPDEAIDSYFDTDIFVLETNEQNISDCKNEAADENIASDKEEGEIEEAKLRNETAKEHFGGDAFPRDKENEEHINHESCKVEETEVDNLVCEKEEGEIEEAEHHNEAAESNFGGEASHEQDICSKVEEIIWEKEEGEIDEDGINHEAHFLGDVLVPLKMKEQCENVYEAPKVVMEIDQTLGDVKDGDNNEEEGSEDADTDEEGSDEGSEDHDNNELLSSESEEEEEEEIEQLGNVTDTDEEEDYNGYIKPIRSTNELVIPPSVKPVEATLQPHHQLQAIGLISSIVGAQVIVEGNELHNPLNEGSVLWITESKRSLGAIDEIFGPVKNPFYVVRFNSENDVPSQIQTGTPISFVEEFSKHILNNSVLLKKGYDASGENDEEVSDDGEFSDDEKEAQFRREQKLSKRALRDTKQKTKPPKWKDNQHLTAANPPQRFNPCGNFPRTRTPVWNDAAPYRPPQTPPFIPPPNPPSPYGIPPQNSPLPCGFPVHDLVWSALNQLTQNYQFPASNHFSGQPLNLRTPPFPPYSHIPSNQLNFPALNIGFPPNPPPDGFPAPLPGGFPAVQEFNPGINPTFNFGAPPNSSNGFRGRGRSRHF